MSRGWKSRGNRACLGADVHHQAETQVMAGLHMTCLREGSGVRGRVRKWLLASAISREWRGGVG